MGENAVLIVNMTMAGYEQKQRLNDTGRPLAYWVEGETSATDAEAWDGHPLRRVYGNGHRRCETRCSNEHAA